MYSIVTEASLFYAIIAQRKMRTQTNLVDSLEHDMLYIVSAINQINCNYTHCGESMYTNKYPADTHSTHIKHAKDHPGKGDLIPIKFCHDNRS